LAVIPRLLAVAWRRCSRVFIATPDSRKPDLHGFRGKDILVFIDVPFLCWQIIATMSTNPRQQNSLNKAI